MYIRLLIVLVMMTGLARVEATPDAQSPNIVIIFTDDQGYGDLGCYGAKGFETLHLDRLAAEGVRFTQFTVPQAVCSASRAALLTGCYPNRVSILGALGPNANHGLHADETTIAELLRDRGYRTAIVGKWHLGHREPFLPTRHGFDEYFGIPYSNDMWPVEYDGRPLTDENHGGKPWKANYPALPLFENDEIIEQLKSLDDQDQITRRYTERSLDFIERAVAANRPFFLYLAHTMPHTPLGVSDRFRDASEYGRYGDVIMEIDWSVGEIMRVLDRLGVAEDTLVIFTSDNGPWLNFGRHAGTTGGLREGKGTAWEGGVRVPCIMRWPAVIPEGTVCEAFASTIDVLPTIASIVEASLPDRPIDGVDLSGLLHDPDSTEGPREHFYYYYGKRLRFVRAGPWKLSVPHEYRSYEPVEPRHDGMPGPYGKGSVEIELFNLETDPFERHDVAADHPEIVQRLLELAESARADLGDHDRQGVGVRPHGVFDIPDS
ncbi:MAG: sulfatase [Phycisphaerales bacterium]